MMGAMPAAAARMERRNPDQKHRCPGEAQHGGHPSTSSAMDTSASPNTSSPYVRNQLPEVYICGLISLLHVAVIFVLLGAVTLIVGLVKLKPGSNGSDQKYYLISIGCLMDFTGVMLCSLRCFILDLRLRRQAELTLNEHFMEEGATEDPGPSRGEVRSPRVLNRRENSRRMGLLTPEDVAHTTFINLSPMPSTSDLMFFEEPVQPGVRTYRRPPAPLRSEGTTIRAPPVVVVEAKVHQRDDPSF